MSLIEELKAVPPGYSGQTPYNIETHLDVEIVSDEYKSSGRWSEHHTAVFKRGDEYVALDYQVPATEYQEGGDFDWEFYAVTPVKKVVEITEYIRA